MGVLSPWGSLHAHSTLPLAGGRRGDVAPGDRTTWCTDGTYRPDAPKVGCTVCYRHKLLFLARVGALPTCTSHLVSRFAAAGAELLGRAASGHEAFKSQALAVLGVSVGV